MRMVLEKRLVEGFHAYGGSSSYPLGLWHLALSECFPPVVYHSPKELQTLFLATETLLTINVQSFRNGNEAL